MPVPLVWSHDKTRALIVDERGWIEPRDAVRLEFTYRGDLPDLPPLSREGRIDLGLGIAQPAPAAGS